MKLKTLVAISLLASTFIIGTIMVMGLWIVPSDKTPVGSTVIDTSNAVPSTVAESAGGTTSKTTTTKPQSSSSASNKSTSNSSSTSTKKSTSSRNSPSSGSTTSGGGSGGGSGASSGGGTTTKPCGTANGPCTASQVATHNSQGDCWVIYSSNYYIVTSYVNQHPGGSDVFNSSTCGKNISTYLSGGSSTAGARHKHGGSAYTILNSYKVGPVQ